MSSAAPGAGGPWTGLMVPVQDFGSGFGGVVEIGAEAERLGFDSLWVGDHLAFRQPVTEAIVTASMLAARTERISIGFGILQIAMRQPVWLAKQLGTLAALSGGRIQLGVGIGGENPEEWEAAGVPRTERVARTAELVPLLRLLLAGEPVEWKSEHYELRSPPLVPAPPAPPPVWMGGRGDGALRRAAELAEGWLGLWIDGERMRRSVAELGRLAALAGRPTPAAALVVPVLVEPDRARAERRMREFVSLQYGLALEKVERWCLAGDLERVAEGLGELSEAGSTGFVLMPASGDARAELESLAELRRLVGGRS